jgi:hypothetical protein
LAVGIARRPNKALAGRLRITVFSQSGLFITREINKRNTRSRSPLLFLYWIERASARDVLLPRRSPSYDVGMGIYAPCTYSIVGFLISVIYFHKFILSSYPCQGAHAHTHIHTPHSHPHAHTHTHVFTSLFPPRETSRRKGSEIFVLTCRLRGAWQNMYSSLGGPARAADQP